MCSNGASLYDVRRRVSLAEHPIADAVIDEILVTLAAELPGCFYGWETATTSTTRQRFLAYRPPSTGPPARTSPSGSGRRRSAS